ncbi:hypothetical protein KAS79_02550 [Candidatus Parcubacteria bacterium]|nr:hypothetical protein [Candidatus Parcubacteria bacterium]
MNKRKENQKGIIITLTLVFGFIFLLLLGGLLGFILLQQRESLRKASWNDALHIAEAGTNYYRWRLNQYIEAENPDVQDGNTWCCKIGEIEYGQDAPECRDEDFIVCGVCDGEPCYEHEHYNPQGELVGKFVLKIKAKKICGQILGVYVNSTGFTEKYPDLKRKIEAKFASTSIAEFGSIIHEAVWRAEEEKTSGKFHTNLGLKMDAVNNSLVSSSKSDKDSGEGWLCDSSFGCSSAFCPDGCHAEGVNCRCNGVCGAGSPKDLWNFPAAPFDFTGITNDLDGIEVLAQTKTDGKGYYGASGEKGYHIIFNGDGTFDIRKVTEVSGIWPAYDMKERDWITSYEKITAETNLAQSVELPCECGLIYVEDNLWIEGIVKGKFTVAAANLTNPPIDPCIFIVGDLDYSTLDGSDSLAMIAEENILVTLDCDWDSGHSDEIVMRGVFVAQNGYVGRRGYWSWAGSEERRIRDKLLTYGTIVSYIRGEVTYLTSPNPDDIFSGFREWNCHFDAKLSRDPPPLLPYVSEELELISWEEIQ